MLILELVVLLRYYYKYYNYYYYCYYYYCYYYYCYDYYYYFYYCYVNATTRTSSTTMLLLQLLLLLLLLALISWLVPQQGLFLPAEGSVYMLLSMAWCCCLINAVGTKGLASTHLFDTSLHAIMPSFPYLLKGWRVWKKRFSLPRWL